MSCFEPGTPCNLLDPEAEPDLGPIAPAPAPLPDPDQTLKPGPRTQPDITDTDRYLHAKPDQELDTTGASAAQVVKAIEILVEAAFKAQALGAATAFDELKQRPEPAPDWILGLIAGIAEAAVGVTLGQIAGLIARALPVSESASKIISSQLGRVASGLGKSAGQVVRTPAGEDIAVGSANDGELLGAYRSGVDAELVAAQATGRSQLVLSANALEALPARALLQMVENLAPTAANIARLMKRQHDEIMLGWVQLTGAATLGIRAPGGPEIPTALSTAVGLDGFVDIFISCPQRIEGLNGCKLRSVVVNSHPAAVATLKDLPISLLELPVYRKVFISSLAPGWAAGPSFVIAPSGAIEVMPGATTLAAIGSGREAGESEIGPWVDGYDDRQSQAQREAAVEFQRSLWLGQALMGASLVNDLLGRTRMKDVE